MKTFSSSNRLGMEWFSHTTEEQPVIRLHSRHCPLPMPDMYVEQAADRVHLRLHDRVTCTTKITNTGLTAATHIQYRTTLPIGMRLVENSFTINDIPIPMKVDNHNVITVILRDMPVGDLLLVSFQMQVDSQPEGNSLHSATLDYHFRPEPNTLSIGNTPSNTVEYTGSPHTPIDPLEIE